MGILKKPIEEKRQNQVRSYWLGRCRLMALVIVIVMIMGIFSGCAPSFKEGSLQLDIAGGLILEEQGNEIVVRAYSPEVWLEVERESNQHEPITLIVENVPADIMQVVLQEPSSGQEAAELNFEVMKKTAIKVTLEGGVGLQQLHLSWKEEKLPNPLTIAMIGDNQGNDDVLEKIIEKINASEASFLIHLGDMVPSGKNREYETFMETMTALEIPWFGVPGNHDVRGEGMDIFQQLLAPRYYHFDLQGVRYLFLDTSALGMDSEQEEWFRQQLGGEMEKKIFTHVPFYDPRGRDHTFIDQEKAIELTDLMTEEAARVTGVFAGHIHMFHHGQKEDVDFVVSGGAGARLYAAEEEGGFHHYTLVNLKNPLQVEVHQVEAPPRSMDLVVTGRKMDMEFTFEELIELSTIKKEGQFQNAHGNFRSSGVYGGVPIQTLVEKTGGMKPKDVLVVHSWDGYRQEYAYENVYPEEADWYQYQGDMILAVEYDGKSAPEWEEGHRIVFLPEDGIFDNEDLLKTSAPGQGGHVYLSAGSRWVRMISRLEVIPWKNQ